MIEKKELKVSEDQISTRLDLVLHQELELSRAYIKELIEAENILVNGKKVKASYKTKLNDCVEVNIPEAQELDIEAQDIPLDIVFEDEDLVVVNKPINMVTHPAPGLYKDTLVNALLFHFGTKLSGINGIMRPGIVHRLDKDTSGLIVVAKNDAAHEALAKQIQDKSCKRIYQCLVQGKLKIDGANLEINRAIGRDPKQRNRMTVITDTRLKSRSALTIVKVLEHFRFKEKDYSFLECELKTGRTHQIRVHLSHIRHPILGDLTYGAKKTNHIKIERPLLHAKKISFIHPRTKKKMFFEIDLADDLNKLVSILSCA